MDPTRGFRPSRRFLRRSALLGGSALTLAVGVIAIGCGGSGAASTTTAAGGNTRQEAWPDDDKTMCDWKTRRDVDVVYSAGPGSFQPNVRRVFKVAGEKDSKRVTLQCREADTNLDGIKDVVRFYNAKGEPQIEKADTNFDGKMDVWVTFVNGRVTEVQEDTNGDGKPDVFRYYTDGVTSRVKRDRNFDGRADVWEIYSRGRLERMGSDLTFDGQVDRWDRDQEVTAMSEEAEQRDAGAESTGTKKGGAPPAASSAPPPPPPPPAEPAYSEGPSLFGPEPASATKKKPAKK